jgi:hypothetical protein
LRAATFTILAALSVAGPACDSHQQSVCQKIGDCSQGGDSDWIARCQAEADALRSEAAGNGCAGAFDRYYSCADSSYSCQGATATFPGCDQARAELDACLAAATATTACAMLSAAEAVCGATSADAGVPPACTAARDCQARCYLTSVTNVCAPRVDEIESLTACAAVCPP